MKLVAEAGVVFFQQIGIELGLLLGSVAGGCFGIAGAARVRHRVSICGLLMRVNINLGQLPGEFLALRQDNFAADGGIRVRRRTGSGAGWYKMVPRVSPPEFAVTPSGLRCPRRNRRGAGGSGMSTAGKSDPSSSAGKESRTRKRTYILLYPTAPKKYEKRIDT